VVSTAAVVRAAVVAAAVVAAAVVAAAVVAAVVVVAAALVAAAVVEAGTVVAVFSPQAASKVANNKRATTTSRLEPVKNFTNLSLIDLDQTTTRFPLFQG
jgi:hypothetical protein